MIIFTDLISIAQIKMLEPLQEHYWSLMMEVNERILSIFLPKLDFYYFKLV